MEKSGKNPEKAVGASILKDSTKSKTNEIFNNKPELKPVIKSGKNKNKTQAPMPPSLLLPTSTPPTSSTVLTGGGGRPGTPPQSAIVEVGIVESKLTADHISSSQPNATDQESLATEKDKEESGYDSDQTLATLSAKDSASEASSLNSPASLVKNKQGSEQTKTNNKNNNKDCDSDVEQDLSLDSIVTQNTQVLKSSLSVVAQQQPPTSPPPPIPQSSTPQQEVILRSTSSQPPVVPSLLVPSTTTVVPQQTCTNIDKIEAQFCSLDPTLLENVTSVEVDWFKKPDHPILLQNNKNNTEILDINTTLEEDEELKALCDEERSSVASSIPMDFGDSLPPTLTNLIHKQFSLYR